MNLNRTSWINTMTKQTYEEIIASVEDFCKDMDKQYDSMKKGPGMVAMCPERNRKLSETAKKYWRSEHGKNQRSELQKENWIKNHESMTAGLAARYEDGKLGKLISERLKSSEKFAAYQKRTRKPIQTPDGIFESRRAAAEHYGFKDPTRINGKIKRFPDEWYYINK